MGKYFLSSLSMALLVVDGNGGWGEGREERREWGRGKSGGGGSKREKWSREREKNEGEERRRE